MTAAMLGRDWTIRIRISRAGAGVPMLWESLLHAVQESSARRRLNQK